jgi:hypothetical protein
VRVTAPVRLERPRPLSPALALNSRRRPRSGTPSIDKGPWQALRRTRRPLFADDGSGHDACSPIAVFPRRARSAHRSQPRPRAASRTGRRLPTSATVRERGHTERSTIPRTDDAFSTPSAAEPGCPGLAAGGTAPGAPFEASGSASEDAAPHRQEAAESAYAQWRRGRLDAFHAPPVAIGPAARPGMILAIEHAGRGLLPTRRANGGDLPQAEVPSTVRNRRGGANSQPAVAPTAEPVKAGGTRRTALFRSGGRRLRAPKDPKPTRSHLFSPPSAPDLEEPGVDGQRRPTPPRTGWPPARRLPTAAS